MTAVSQLDQEKSERFSQRMLATLNHGGLSLMLSIGYRTGLFDCMAELAPSTSGEIARASDLNERYVREWLGAMVTGKVVDYDHETKKYSLPAEHAVSLTRKNKPGNISVTMQWLGVLASVEDDIVECFRKGGGVSYEKFSRFHQVMADESHQTVVTPLLDQIVPLADGLKAKLEKGIEVADIGCGSGQALNLLARTFPSSRFTGYDFCHEAIAAGNLQAGQSGLKNIRFIQSDAAAIHEREAFDLILTFDAIHDQKDPAAVLSNIYRALKPGGIYLMQEIAGSSFLEKNADHPIAPFLYTISCMHCMSVSLAGDGAGLGTLWGRETALAMLHQTGFRSVEVKKLPHDFINDYYIVRRSEEKN